MIVFKLLSFGCLAGALGVGWAGSLNLLADLNMLHIPHTPMSLTTHSMSPEPRPSSGGLNRVLGFRV